jgi:hypothetical protein
MASIKLPPSLIGRLLRPFASSPRRYKRSPEPRPFHPQHFAPSSFAYPCPESPNTMHRRRVPFLRCAAGCHSWKGSPLPYPSFPPPTVWFSPPEWPQGRTPVSPLATTACGPRCAHRPPSRSGSRDHKLGLWYFPVEK